MVGARAATESDATTVADLRAAARHEAASKRGGESFVATAEATAPAPAHTAVIVGLIGEVAVGVATVVRTGTVARLTELFTLPDAREVGVGHAMLTQAITVARDWGCSGIDSYALPGDRDTKNFFESHAMKSRLLVVHRSL